MNIKTTLFLASLSALVSLPTQSMAQNSGQMTAGEGSQDGFQAADPGPAPARGGGFQFNQNRLRFGVDAALAIPMGNWGNVAGLGIGVLGHVEHPIQDKLYMTGRAGFIYHFGESNQVISTSVWEIPILAGVKYFVMPEVFLTGEAGFDVMHVSTEMKSAAAAAIGAQSSHSATKFYFAINLGAGYQINQNLNVRASFYFVNPFDATEFMVGAGYSF